MTILGLDPGEQTGYARIKCVGGRPRLIEFGVVPVIEPGRIGLVNAISGFLCNATQVPDPPELVMSEIVQMPRLPTSHAALEVQGVCRLFGAIGYHPQTVHSQLGTRRKSDVAGLLESVFGVRMRPDHAADACAAALCHAIKLGAISTLNVTPVEPTGLRRSRTRRVATDDPDRQYSNDELVELIRTGRARVL